MLYSQYPDCGIILGADINSMDIPPILKCGLKLRPIVDSNTRGSKIHDVLITNLGQYYDSPLICSPISADDPSTRKPSDHSVPVCLPHTDRYHPPVRKYRTIKYRPLPESGVKLFGQWFVTEK